MNIHAKKLVVGDLLKIEEGMNIPCDGFIVKAQDIKTDESAMTGETDVIKKNTQEKCIKARNKYPASERPNLGNHKIASPILLSGTKVRSPRPEVSDICI